MISEDHQQLGHPLPAYALLALNTMRLMHTAEIAAILKGDKAGSKLMWRLVLSKRSGSVRQVVWEESRCGRKGSMNCAAGN